MIQIIKGLDLPISGKPTDQIESGAPVRHVALLGRDYPDMKPRLLVNEGDLVKLGQPLFCDKVFPRIHYTSPASGQVTAIHRGERRIFQSVVIAVSGTEGVAFSSYPAAELPGLGREVIERTLLESGLWTSLRVRPYSKVPQPQTVPAAIFVTAIDTNPLAADPCWAIQARPNEFRAGLTVLKQLTDGALHLCHAPNLQLDLPDGVTPQQFSGCHPAGLVGTHIHFLEKVDLQRQVWHVGYQDVVAIGHLFLCGQLLPERFIALGGPQVKNPRILRTRVGACLSELLSEELTVGSNRVVSGSILSGRHARGAEDYLGRYHQQISVIREDNEREFLGWMKPGLDLFSLKRVFASALLPKRSFAMTSSNHGSARAMVPIGAYEKVMPLNVKATWLLRALLTEDTDLARGLGCLELDEEDLALCSYVCPGKIDFGDSLRRTLSKIEKEG
jgi:Na+-transporting NADH:ubiquinone oxidoreductase subunit A